MDRTADKSKFYCPFCGNFGHDRENADYSVVVIVFIP